MRIGGHQQLEIVGVGLDLVAVQHEARLLPEVIAGNQHALVRQHIDDLDGALTLLRQVPPPIGNDDGSAFVSSRMQMARIHASLNETDKALTDSREVLRLYPDNSEARNFVAALVNQSKPRWVTILSDSVRFLPALLKGALMTLLLVLCTMLISPLGGLLIRFVTPQLSVALTVKLTLLRLHRPASAVSTRLLEQLITEPCVSVTVTVKLQLA